MDLQIIIIYYEVFLIFFLNQFFQKIVFFAFWRPNISERCSLMSGILQGLVKTWKIYIEVNRFTPKLKRWIIAFSRMIF